MAYKNGDAVSAESINNAIDDSQKAIKIATVPIDNSQANQIGVACLIINNQTGGIIAKNLKGETGKTGDTGATGETGATFIPTLATDGTLSWTNDKGKPNPTANEIFKNIKITADNANTKSNSAVTTATAVQSQFNKIVENKIGISQDIKSTDHLTAPSSATVAQALADLTKPIYPVNQKEEVVHLSPTSPGYVDELKLSSAPVQVISPNMFNLLTATVSVGGQATKIDNGFKLVPGQIANNLPTSICTNYIKDNFLKAGTYTISFDCDHNPHSVYFIYELYLATTLISGTRYKTTFTTNKDYILNDNMHIYPTTTSDTEIVLMTNIMFNEGTTALPYEPYTGQPSPTNPIPINVVTSPVEIVSRGINVLSPITIDNHDSGNLLVNSSRKDEGTYVLNGGIFTVNSNPRLINALPVSSLVQTVRIEVLSGSTTAVTSYFAVYKDSNQYGTVKLNAIGGGVMTIPANTESGFYIMNILELCSFTNYTFRIEIIEGDYTFENYPLYEPFNSVQTSLPLVIESGEHAGQTAELLGEYNTKSNVLEQEWGKWKIIPTEVYQFPNYEKDKTTVFLMYGWGAYLEPIMTEKGYCTHFKEVNVGSILYDLDESCCSFVPGSSPPYMAVRIEKALVSNVEEFNVWWASNNVKVYYELANPEILTLKPTPPVPTLAGTTNIYAINNAAPVMFDVTELLDGGNQINTVLKDKDGNVLNLRTTAEQVKVNEDGRTLDRELESIQASIYDVKAELSTEAMARAVGDTAIREELADGALVAKNATNAVNQPQTDSSTKIANTAYVRQAISDVKNIEYGSVTLVEQTAKLQGSSLKRQVNFVLCNFILLPKTSDSLIITEGILVNLEEGFRPLKTKTFTNLYYANTTLTLHSIKITITPNGDVRISLDDKNPEVFAINLQFGFEVEQL